MTERRLYKCDICGTEYASKDNAIACEQSHRIPKKVRAYRYNAMRTEGKYPQVVTITFDDGSEVRYSRF